MIGTAFVTAAIALFGYLVWWVLCPYTACRYQDSQKRVRHFWNKRKAFRWASALQGEWVILLWENRTSTIVLMSGASLDEIARELDAG